MLQQGCTHVESLDTLTDLATYLMLDIDTMLDLDEKGLVRTDWLVGLYFYKQES